MTPYSFTRRNRNSRTLIILASVYMALLALVILFDAAWWIVGLLSLATLPAIWDVIQNTSAGVQLDRDAVRWFTGNRQGDIPMRDIDHFRFDTRWDFSVRVSIVLKSEKRIRLPDESLPPHRELETILKQAGFRVDRHHFTVF
ncbi:MULTISPECIES: hypothetical protein [unclassified Ruegeria]|uniref:hypothetical protein n=1 Tax=unclassified Ruegeria TaxID=2625375 RepID=UPI001AE9097C|nr:MULTISPECIES: hypothetical protein [unclassified Ruegeria]